MQETGTHATRLPSAQKVKLNKKKAMVAECSWNDDEDLLAKENNYEETKTANLCLVVTTDDEVNSNIFSDLSNDEHVS